MESSYGASEENGVFLGGVVESRFDTVGLTSFNEETASTVSDDGESEMTRSARRRGKVALGAIGLWFVVVAALGTSTWNKQEGVVIEEVLESTKTAAPLSASGDKTSIANDQHNALDRNTEKTFTRPPSIALITIDDAGWNDLGYQTLEEELVAATPRMNEYAMNGVRLTQYYGQPSCSPSRGTILTGIWVHRLGFQDTEVSAYSNFSTPLRYSTVAQRLKLASNYETLGWGKWNIGHCAESMLPWNRGFDYFLGYMTAAVDYRNRATGRNYTHGGQEYELVDQLEGYAAGVGLAAHSEKSVWRKPEDWIFENNTYDSLLYGRFAAKAWSDRKDSERPVFTWLAFHGVHADNDDFDNITDAELYEQEEEEGEGQGLTWLKNHMTAQGATNGRVNFGQALYVVDYAIGLTVEAMRDAGHLGVVVVHSDNGAMPCTYGGLTADLPGSNFPLRSGKFQYFEGGVRVPAFIYAPTLLPASTKGGVYAGLMHHVDWLPTFVVGLAGATLDDDEAVDGLDHWAYIAAVDAQSDLNKYLQQDNGIRAPPADITIGPRTEIVLDISTSSLNLTYGESAAPVDLRLPYSEAVVAYRYKNLKLLRRHTTDEHAYDFDRQYFPNCTAMFCQMNRESYSAQEDRCDFQDFVFNLTADPYESQNLAEDPAYHSIRHDLEERARRHFKYAFYQPLNKISRSSVTANHAFYKAGGVVAPWVTDDEDDSDDQGCRAIY